MAPSKTSYVAALEEKVEKHGAEHLIDAIFSLYHKTLYPDKTQKILKEYANAAKEIFETNSTEDFAKIALNIYYLLEDYNSMEEIVKKMRIIGLSKPTVLHTDDNAAKMLSEIVEKTYETIVVKKIVRKKVAS